MTPQHYLVRYDYVRPGPAGPFRGKFESRVKHVKGDTVWGPFGEASVTSCRKVSLTTPSPTDKRKP